MDRWRCVTDQCGLSFRSSSAEFCSLLQYVLAVGSSVFGAMFYGDLAEGQSEIHIPDVQPAAFLILLK